VLELLGETAAGIGTIGKDHRNHLRYVQGLSAAMTTPEPMVLNFNQGPRTLAWAPPSTDPQLGRCGEGEASGRVLMSEVARVTEISARSGESFEDAIKVGIERATRTLRGVSSAWVKEQQVKVEDDRVVEYQVNLLVTFVLD
jgi:flavin-binding protein dodecin